MPDDDPAALHISVMLRETIALMSPAPGTTMLDCTLGMGGHSAALLERGARVCGVDRDPAARDLASGRLAAFGEAFSVREGTYRQAVADDAQAGNRYDAVLADLGVSSLQLDDDERGFGIRSELSADMRMGDGCDEDAVDLIRRTGEKELADMIREYGEERFAGRVARVLKEAVRANKTTAVELADAVRAVVPGRQQRHPALRAFQALRIVVNDELGQLDGLLEDLPKVLKPGGIAVLISFHSLEDRRVKNAFRDGKRSGIYSEISKKPLTATEDELAVNRRAHSAKMRWARLAEEGVSP